MELSKAPSSSGTASTESKAVNQNSKVVRKRRLATTRGFDNQNHNFITPNCSPVKESILKSTPIITESNQQVEGVSVIRRTVKLPPHPPFSPIRSCLLPPLPPRRRYRTLSPDCPAAELSHSLDTSLEWDNFIQSPSYSLRVENNLKGSNNNTGLEDINQITLVDLSESNSSVNMSRENLELKANETEAITQNMRQLNGVLTELRDKVYDMMEDFTAADVRKGNSEFVHRELEKISEARGAFRSTVRKYKNKFSHFHPTNCQALDEQLLTMNNRIREHAASIWSKVEQLQVQSQSEPKFVEPQVTLTRPTPVDISGDLAFKQKTFRDQLLYLTEALDLPASCTVEEHWKEKSESEVCQAMKDLSIWQKNLERLSTTFREYEKLSIAAGSDTNFESDSDDFENIRVKLKEVVLAVKNEDERRNLQTLLPSKADKIKYPVFSGDPGEDLVRFKVKMQECFKKNRVPYSDQLDKLRENLRGQALKRVPETLKSLETAWDNLSEAFGSPIVVLKERLKTLAKLGTVPPDTNPAKQISWFLDFESALQDIIDLGSTDDLNMQMGAFGPPVQEQILKAFNDNQIRKREVASAGQNLQPKEKIQSYLAKVQIFRKEVQLAEVESGSTSDKKRNPAVVGSSALPSVHEVSRNESSRICQYFSKQGNSQRYQLFDNHMGDGTFQCPVFMKLKVKERMQLGIKIKLCQYCLDSKIITDKQHERDCKDRKPPNSDCWKCASPGCGRHSWVCQTHADNANKKKLKRYSERLFRKGFEFSYPIIYNSSVVVNAAEVSAAQALEKQVDRELLPVPDGHPMFLFFGAKGKTRSLMCFFDSGCSRFVMKDCIPGKELPASCIRKEKIAIGGIGATTVYAEGEYLVAMETVDGKFQQMQGVVVQSITSEFPTIDLSHAAAEVMRCAPKNKSMEFRKCKFPNSIGGSVDCLVGIQYNQLQPRLMHMFPSGLAVYKTKLAPHNKGYNYVLGGPHSSFDTWLAQHGNQNHVLLENFIAGLTRWRTQGPASLTQYIMSESEEHVASKKNMIDDEFSYYKELTEYEHNEFFQAETQVKNQIDESSIREAALHSSEYQICDDCGTDMIGDLAMYEDQKLSRLKQILDSQETGLDISYRCVRCRDCNDCRNAEKVDKISLREEAEDYEIKNSVTLDWARKKIFVSLPLRGKERDFLTSNESRALKVLDSQCRKYFNDSETKIAVNLAFKKLIDKGFIKFLEDLTDAEKNLFINKEVQYWLPWRIQFKPGSASTPVRVVFDASSRTSTRRDKTGGRCLNDAVCKGSIDTLDLMRVVLRFMIGKFALVADISKMYNQFSLIPEFWNLQRVLIWDDLNPDIPVRQACVTTAIYGVKSSAGQTEYGLREIAEHVREEKPTVADLLTTGRYVDNLIDSKVTKEEAVQLAGETTEVLNRLNIPTKGFSFTGDDPQPEESIDGISIDVNSMKWITSTDAIEIKIPLLHFGTKRRGRVVGVDYFEPGGSFAKMDQFVPQQLTRRMIVSKRASLYDFLGKLEPIKAKLKLDEREVVLLTSGWDDVVSPEVRNKWISNFLLLEQL